MKNIKSRVALLSVLSNIILILLKLTAGFLSDSVSIISEAIHSAMDLVAAVIAFFSVSYSSKPADDDHPYGHGKVENISGCIEGILIFIAAGLIILEAAKKIIHPVPISETGVAIAVMFISAVVNIGVSSILYKTAKSEDSIALEADALHLKTDVYTSAGVGLGILLIQLTDIHILDPIVAILVALLIIKEAYHLCVTAFSPLLDAKLPDHEEELIRKVLSNYRLQIGDFHDLKTRKSGHCRYIDLHITVDPQMSVQQSHTICDCIEEELKGCLSNVIISIHTEPEQHHA